MLMMDHLEPSTPRELNCTTAPIDAVSPRVFEKRRISVSCRPLFSRSRPGGAAGSSRRELRL